MRVILVREDKPRTTDKDDRGYGLPLVTTDLTSSPEMLVARYDARWCVEVAFSEARQTLGVGEARNRVKKAVERTVPFGMICLSLVAVWYMTIKLRRVVIAARFRGPRPDLATPEETRAVLVARAATGT